MELGLFVPQPDGPAQFEVLTTLARSAEACGFDSLWVGEHAVLFDHYEPRYPYSASGEWPFGDDRALHSPFELLSYLAAATSRIRLGTSVIILPQRNPVYTAKSAATLDCLSNGRLDLGIGVGWSKEEFAALGVPFERRGERCNEYVEVMVRLWSGEAVSFTGEFYELTSARQRPRPVQHPHPPIYFGGESDAALERVAEHGNGWFGFNLTPAALTERLERLHSATLARGRTDNLRIVTGRRDLITLDELAAYRDAGVTQFVFNGPALSSGTAPIEYVEQLAATFSGV